ncbi:hypothetical protein C8Q75DRAFT_48709 [Abortiporus biennis]|nr:hypothetical protein C8Q75DRAFT_48709 [Abortiporus biennis]
MSSLPDPDTVATCEAIFRSVVNKTFRHVLGGTIIELFIMTILYGVILVQSYTYLLYNASQDSLFMRVFTASLFVVETVHTALAICIGYNYLIIDSGDIQGLATISWTVGACFICGMVIVAMVQTVYIRRLWLLTSQLLIPFLLAVTLFLRAVAYLASIGLLYKFSNWTSYPHQPSTKITVNASLALTVFGDVMICITQVHHLYQSRTGGKRTDNALTLLIAYSLRSGLLSVIVSVAAIMTFTLSQDTLTWTGLMLISSKLYANSMFSSLNARRMLRRTLAVPFEPSSLPERIEVIREIEAVTEGDSKYENDTSISLTNIKSQKRLTIGDPERDYSDGHLDGKTVGIV